LFYRIPLAILLLSGSLWLANPNTNSNPPSAPLQTESDLTMLTVTVRSRSGDFVAGLHREAFEIIDDKEARSVEFFDSSDTPLSIGIVVDNSNSMKEVARGAIGQALSRFFALSNPQNEYFALAFDTKPRFLSDWESGRALISQISNLAPEGRNTAMYDALLVGIEKLQSAHHPKRAIFVITDGLDNSSHHTFYQLRESLKKSDVLFFAFRVATSSIGTAPEMEGSKVLTELAEITGGTALRPYDQEQNHAIELLALQLRNLYRLGFRPAQNNQAGRWRRIKIKVTLSANVREEFSKLTATTRQGYYTK
jgi:Ca-activated chloride channel family protein